MITIQKGLFEHPLAGGPDQDDYVDFINYVFGMNGADNSFSTLLPKLYKAGRRSERDTYFALEEGKILGTVGAFPLTYSVGGALLSARGIGSVAVHPRRRGEGLMKALMRRAIDDMAADGIDLSVLSGRRRRYAFYGYEKCDGMRYFELTGKAVLDRKTDSSPIVMRPVEEKDTALLDALHAAMNARPYHVARSREDLYDILCSWRSRPYAFFENDRLVGWTIHYEQKRQLSEFSSLDPALTKKMLAAAVERLGSLSAAIPAWDNALCGEADFFAETAADVSHENFLVLNWEKVLGALFSFKAERVPLADGSLTLKIEGVKGPVVLEIAVQRGIPRITEKEGTPTLTLSSVEAEALFFRPYAAARSFLSPAAASWLPLPLFVYAADNV